LYYFKVIINKTRQNVLPYQRGPVVIGVGPVEEVDLVVDDGQGEAGRVAADGHTEENDLDRRKQKHEQQHSAKNEINILVHCVKTIRKETFYVKHSEK